MFCITYLSFQVFFDGLSVIFCMEKPYIDTSHNTMTFEDEKDNLLSSLQTVSVLKINGTKLPN